MKKFFLTWGPVLAYGGLIYIQSAFPQAVPIGFPLDKIIHFFEFSLLGFFIIRSFLLTWNIGQWTAVFLAGTLAGLWGVLDEIHQSFVPARNASWGDGLADILGAFAGAAAFLWFGKYLYRRKLLYEKQSCEMAGNCPVAKG